MRQHRPSSFAFIKLNRLHSPERCLTKQSTVLAYTGIRGLVGCSSVQVGRRMPLRGVVKDTDTASRLLVGASECPCPSEITGRQPVFGTIWGS